MDSTAVIPDAPSAHPEYAKWRIQNAPSGASWMGHRNVQTVLD
jgi:hypothetical protein